MRVAHCPIDTALNFVQARKLVRDLKPGCLVLPECYTRPPASAPGRTDLTIEAVGVLFMFAKNNPPPNGFFVHVDPQGRLSAPFLLSPKQDVPKYTYERYDTVEVPIKCRFESILVDPKLAAKLAPK